MHLGVNQSPDGKPPVSVRAAAGHHPAQAHSGRVEVIFPNAASASQGGNLEERGAAGDVGFLPSLTPRDVTLLLWLQGRDEATTPKQAPTRSWKVLVHLTPVSASGKTGVWMGRAGGSGGGRRLGAK